MDPIESMGDFRETFIVNCVQTLCPESASVSLDDLENQPLSDFLNDLKIPYPIIPLAPETSITIIYVRFDDFYIF